MELQHLYRAPGVPEGQRRTLFDSARALASPEVEAVDTEHCFNIELARRLSGAGQEVLRWLLAETFEPARCRPSSFLDPAAGPILEVGPRMSFTTAWSTNAVAVCHACGLDDVRRIERSRRYLLRTPRPIAGARLAAFLASVHDRMTECRYLEPLRSFATGVRPQPVFEVPLLAEGRPALERINREMGLAFDDWDLDYYTELFARRIGRNPTNVECFDIAQSNSEHSRHWFFRGRLVIDGVAAPDHLIGMVRQTLEANPNNSVIAFHDNSSAIRGHRVRTLHPASPGAPGPLLPRTIDEHVLFTAETHNFPSGVSPIPGAETGTGGRLRDTHATGRGSL